MGNEDNDNLTPDGNNDDVVKNSDDTDFDIDDAELDLLISEYLGDEDESDGVADGGFELFKKPAAVAPKQPVRTQDLEEMGEYDADNANILGKTTLFDSLLNDETEDDDGRNSQRDKKSREKKKLAKDSRPKTSKKEDEKTTSVILKAIMAVGACILIVALVGIIFTVNKITSSGKGLVEYAPQTVMAITIPGVTTPR